MPGNSPVRLNPLCYSQGGAVYGVHADPQKMACPHQPSWALSPSDRQGWEAHAQPQSSPGGSGGTARYDSDDGGYDLSTSWLYDQPLRNLRRVEKIPRISDMKGWQLIVKSSLCWIHVSLDAYTVPNHPGSAEYHFGNLLNFRESPTEVGQLSAITQLEHCRQDHQQRTQGAQHNTVLKTECKIQSCRPTGIRKARTWHYVRACIIKMCNLEGDSEHSSVLWWFQCQG